MHVGQTGVYNSRDGAGKPTQLAASVVAIGKNTLLSVTCSDGHTRYNVEVGTSLATFTPGVSVAAPVTEAEALASAAGDEVEAAKAKLDAQEAASAATLADASAKTSQVRESADALEGRIAALEPKPAA